MSPSIRAKHNKSDGQNYKHKVKNYSISNIIKRKTKLLYEFIPNLLKYRKVLKYGYIIFITNILILDYRYNKLI